jgi:hypothetical protein
MGLQKMKPRGVLINRRVLAISFRIPYPLTDGANIRIYNIGRILAQKYQVDLLTINEGGVANEDVKELENTFDKVIAYPFHPMRFRINTLKGLLSRDSLQIYYHHFGKVQKWIDKHYADYDLIFCFHIRMTRYLRKITDKPKVSSTSSTRPPSTTVRPKKEQVERGSSSIRSRTAGLQPTNPSAYIQKESYSYSPIYEGFGLPPLEAMACGKPAVVSNAASLPEVVGDAGILVNPHKTDDIVGAMAQMLQDESTRSRLIARGLKRARSFTWEEIPKELLAVYRRGANS